VSRSPERVTERGHRPIAAAGQPQPGFEPERLLVIDPLTRRFGDYRVSELPQLVWPGDVVVLNDAATLPASLRVDDGLELRLMSAEPDGTFRALSLGRGDVHDATEARGQPRALRAGQTLSFGEDLSARVLEVDDRLLRLDFEQEGARFWSALYRYGKPIQYAYADRPFQLWDVQNRYAARPWAFELPSAGRPLTFQTLFALEGRGATVAQLTHAASISSTGSAELDARLPLPERAEIGEATTRAIARARLVGGRVIAVGTSVVRALEGRADDGGELAPGAFVTELRLGPSYQPRVVDGVQSGLHEPGTSHFELLEAFAPRALLERAFDHAARTGYLQHEFGDSCLVLPGALLERLEA
jgi:S-adenosylmethionine:tRNA ribosyltransferase-isomerase